MNGLGSILIVDDEETFRVATCRLLRREGFDCHSAGDAEEAINWLRRRPFDLMVADVRMPHNGDLRVVQQARDLDPQMPIVIVTGYPSMESAIRSLELSVAAYLRKPLNCGELLEHARAAIRCSRRRRALSGVIARLDSVLADLKTAQLNPRLRDGEPGEIPLETIRTLAACTSQLLSLSAVSAGDCSSNNLCQLLDCPQNSVYRRAIAETIKVLEKTKDAFKSKALGELRRNLEARIGVLEESRPRN